MYAAFRVTFAHSFVTIKEFSKSKDANDRTICILLGTLDINLDFKIIYLVDAIDVIIL